MVTDAQNKANLGSASNVAAQSLGLDLAQASSWTQDQQIAFTQALAHTVLQYPNDFTSATLSLAQSMTGFTIDGTPQGGPNVVFDTADWSAFGYHLENSVVNAGTKLEDVGNGVLNALSSLGKTVGNAAQAAQNTSAVATWIVPVAAIILLYWLVKDPEKATRSGSNISGAVREYLPY